MQQQRRDFLKWTAAGATGLALARANHAHAAWPATRHPGDQPGHQQHAGRGLRGHGDDEEHADVDRPSPPRTRSSTPPACRPTWTPWPCGWRTRRRRTRLGRPSSARASRGRPRSWPSRSTSPSPRTCPAWRSSRSSAESSPVSGCRPSNIIIYDGGPVNFATNIASYTSYFSATDTSKIPGVISNVNDALGGTSNAPLPNRALRRLHRGHRRRARSTSSSTSPSTRDTSTSAAPRCA